MELKVLKEKARSAISKYRYMILMIVIGIVLLLLPTSGRKVQQATEKPVSNMVETPDLSKQLEDLLSQIDGAGEVRVLLSVASGEERIYQSDTDRTLNGDSQHTKNDTVILAGSDRSQAGLLCRVDPPVYSGAVVVCKGADSPTVRLSVVSAVSKLTGLGADRISVVKMK